jgi:hypothetical protein
LNPLARVTTTIAPKVQALAMIGIVLKFTLVATATSQDKTTISMFPAFTEISYEDSTIGPSLNTITIKKVVVPLANAQAAIYTIAGAAFTEDVLRQSQNSPKVLM